MLCGIGAFQQFICEQSDGWDHRPTTDEAAEWLRSILDTGVDAAVVFDMAIPNFGHDWTWNKAMRAAWREMLAA